MRTGSELSLSRQLAENYAEIANHLGGHGVRVHTCAELGRALAQAYADDSRFQLIEVMLPRGATSKTLAGFVGAVREMSALKGE